MTDGEQPPSREDFDRRFAAAQAKREAEREQDRVRQAVSTSRGLGFRIATELVAAVIVGAGIGYGLDYWLDTSPVFLVGMVVLGFLAFLMNVFRIMKGLDQSVGLGRAIRDAERANAADKDDD